MTRRTRIATLAAALTLALAATGLWAGRPGVVTAGDGARYEGEVTEREGEVVVRTHGVDTVLARGRVASIDYTPYDERFAAALAALDAEDVTGRVALAREAFDRRAYPLAQTALAGALEINPLHRPARELEALVSTQLQLEASTTRPAEADADPDEPAPRATARRVRGLDDAQANRVRQLELQADDDVRIQFRDNVRKRFVDAQPGMDYGSFARRADVAQALAILAKGTPAMVDDVIVRGDPRSIRTFGQRLHGAVLQGCASSNCHGGAGAGAFRLLAGTPDASTMITNFVLLTQYARAVEPDPNNPFDAGSVPMIDRGNARASLLYQSALPRARAKVKHPPVRGWDGLIRDDRDRLAREMIAWMEQDLRRLQPDYGFKFEPSPGTPDPTTSPASATRPATAPTP